MPRLPDRREDKEPRNKGVKTLVSADTKAAFRKQANARGLTESELLRELIEHTVSGEISRQSSIVREGRALAEE